MRRRGFLRNLLGLPILALLSGTVKALPVIPVARTRTRFAFGSCLDQEFSQPIFKAITRADPVAFAMIGDNVYADTLDMNLMRAAYDRLGASPEYQRLRQHVPVIATWDDHDYGINDCGCEYTKKVESKEIMLDFFAEPKDSPRRERAGIYTSYYYGQHPHRLQVILLDLRWNRSQLKVIEGENYVPNDDPSATLLGDEQWTWLERELREPADFRILCSSIQLVSSEHRWEKWSNFPFEKKRILRLMDELQIENLVVASGDMHFAEISTEKTPAGRALFELTSSGLNVTESSKGIPNSKRLALCDTESTFGLVTVDWDAKRVTLEAREVQGNTVIMKEIDFV